MAISPERLEAINAIPDSTIDTSDIPELDDSFWNEAKLVRPKTKQPIFLCVDQMFLIGLKSGKGYQSLMHAVLRAYVEHRQEKYSKSVKMP